MSHRNELQKALRIFRDVENYEISLSLTGSPTWRLQDEFDMITKQHNAKLKREEALRAEIQREREEAMKEDALRQEREDNENCATEGFNGSVRYGAKVHKEYLWDKATVENKETQPYFATLTPYALNYLDDFFSPDHYAFRYQPDRLTKLYEILEAERCILTKNIVTGDKSSMIECIGVLSNLSLDNQRIEKYITDYIVMTHNWCSPLDRVDFTSFFSHIKSLRITHNYDDTRADHTLFVEMVSLMLFRRYFPEFFLDLTDPLPRSRANWESWTTASLDLILKAVGQLFDYSDRKPVKNFSELCFVVANLAGFRGYVQEEVPGEVQSIITPKHPEDPKQGYLSDTMVTPFHAWKNNQILDYCQMIGWNTDNFFTAFSNWTNDRKCLLSAIIEHESLTF